MTERGPAVLGALLTIVLAIVVAWPLSAFAQSVETIVDAVERSGAYVAPDVPEPVDLDRLTADHPDFGYVALGGEPAGGARALASAVLDRTSATTVIVVTPTEIGVESLAHGDAEVRAALDFSAETPGASYVDEFTQITAGLVDAGPTPVPSSPVPSTPVSSTPGIGGWVLLVGFVVVVGAVALVNLRNDRRDEALATSRITSARAEIRAQMDVIANQILELSDRVGPDHPEAVAHFRSASDTFDEADDLLAEAASRDALEALSDALDVARWELAAADAIVSGETVPERPEAEVPQACFFDPSHGAGVERAELRTPAGTGLVWVCADDHRRLAAGEVPQPREIEVENVRVPAPQAPRDHGGGGFDWLDAFSIVVGGMGTDYRWRRVPRGTRTPAGGDFGRPFPGGFGGSRATGGGSRARATGGGSAVRSTAPRSGGGSRRR